MTNQESVLLLSHQYNSNNMLVVTFSGLFLIYKIGLLKRNFAHTFWTTGVWVFPANCPYFTKSKYFILEFIMFHLAS